MFRPDGDRFEAMRREEIMNEGHVKTTGDSCCSYQLRVIEVLEPLATSFPGCLDGLPLEDRIKLVQTARKEINAKKDERIMLSMRLDVVEKAVVSLCQALIDCPDERVLVEVEKLLGRIARVYHGFMKPEVVNLLKPGISRCLTNAHLSSATLIMIGHIASSSYDHANCFRPILPKLFDAAMTNTGDMTTHRNKLSICNPGLFAFLQCIKFVARDGDMPLNDIFRGLIEYLSRPHAHCVVTACLSVIRYFVAANVPGTLQALLDAKVFAKVGDFLRTGDGFIEKSVIKLIMYAYANGKPYAESLLEFFNPLDTVIAKCTVDFIPIRSLAWHCLAVMVTSDFDCFVETRNRGIATVAITDLLEQSYREILGRLRFLWASTLRYDGAEQYNFDVSLLIPDLITIVSNDDPDMIELAIPLLQTMYDHLSTISLADQLFFPAWNASDGQSTMESIASNAPNEKSAELAQHLLASILHS